jgi:hypothetical protein
MVARAQRWLVFGWLVLAVCWTAGWWARSPAIAVAGLLVLAGGHAAFLALEFALAWGVDAKDPLPRAGAGQFLCAWLAESLAAPRVFCWYQPFRWRAVPDQLPSAPRRGVVLVHGFVCNRAFWTPWLHELRAADRAFVAVDLEPAFGSIDRYVQIIDAAIARVAAATGRPPLLVCHSMGGLAARAWLRAADGARVQRIVTIGTPHRGTWLARFGRTANGRQMRMGGEWLQRIDGEHDVVQRVPFTCWYSNCDNIVFPTSVATLPGADNRLAAGRGHVQMAFDGRLRREVLALLDD